MFGIKRWRRRHRFNRKKSYAYLFLFLLCCSIGLGYATLKTDLNILGTAKFNNATWDVHFDNIEVKDGSVVPITAATIQDDTTVSFEAELEEAGEFYEFTVDVVNSGTIDAMIDSFRIQPVLTAEEEEYFDYIVTYKDGTELGDNQKLEAGNTETLRVAFIYKVLEDSSLYPENDKNYTISVSINYVQATSNVVDVPHPPTLYGVLESEAQSGVYAKEYTGEHQDSWAGTGTKKIYHWYATSDANGTAIQNMNNVIFAGHCWQMIRTTDTGGVKMIYNGEPVNNQCLNTRRNHVGYNGLTYQNLANDYYYGTSYTYDSTNQVFSLSGTITHGTWSGTNYEPFIGKYTCKSTVSNGTCSTLYLVESYSGINNAYVISLNSSSNYSQFGTLQYNRSDNSLAHVGYMYNTVYPVTEKNNPFNVTNRSAWTIDTSYYYSDTIDYNVSNANKYTLTNPVLISTLSNYNDLIGKYVLNTTGTNASTARYVTAVDSNKVYYRELSGGDLNISLTIGDSYTESGGVYTLSGNVTNVSYITWYNTSDFSVYKGKYTCDGVSTSCTTLKHITTENSINKHMYYYFDTTANYSYAESVSYDGTTYTLTGDIKTFWDIFDSTNKSYLPTHHYTCLENGTSCTTVGYIRYLDYFSYAQLTGVEDIETAINNMLYADNVNAKNSTIKTGIDAWYEKYLSSYDNYIEDTIFCNNRTITSLGGFKPDGGSLTGSVHSYLYFQDYAATKDLSCDRVTDQFSTLNENAKLTYKAGLISRSEKDLLDNNNILNIETTFWYLSPNRFDQRRAWASYIVSGVSGNGVNTALGLRPSISLNPGTIYASGDGSMANPYVVADVLELNSDSQGHITATLTNPDSDISSIQYSLDNTNWQSSNQFTVSNSGDYTVYAKLNYPSGSSKTVSSTISVTVTRQYTINYKLGLTTIHTETLTEGTGLQYCSDYYTCEYNVKNDVNNAYEYVPDSYFVDIYSDPMWTNSLSYGLIPTQDMDIYIHFGFFSVEYNDFVLESVSTLNDLNLEFVSVTPDDGIGLDSNGNVVANGFPADEFQVTYRNITTGNLIDVKYSLYACLLKDTEILVEEEYEDENKKKRKRRRKKKIQDIDYDDLLVVWDFDNGCFTTAKPLWIAKEGEEDNYYHIEFDDGTFLDVVTAHRIFNVDLGKFTYANDDELTPIGTRVYKEDGSIARIVKKEKIYKDIKFYNIMTHYHMNMFANGILTSCRFNNLYEIKDMKFIKEERKLRDKEEFSDIEEEFIEGLRLLEQPYEDIDKLNAIHHANNLNQYIKWLKKEMKPKKTKSK